MFKELTWRKQADIVANVLKKAPSIDKEYRLPSEEFLERQKKTWDVIQEAGFDCGIVYSDEHYCGDVPYLAGDSNIMVEPIAAVLSRNGLFFISGFESGIVAEQFSRRSGANIRKVDLLKIDKRDYPKNTTTPIEIIEEACGKKPTSIALLTTRNIFPLALYNALRNYIGEENIEDISEKYYQIKYEKSDNEMRLIEESCKISDVILEGMIRILRPGLYETQIAAWGYLLAHEMGIEELGFKVMVTAGQNNKTMIGRASNNIIREGDIVQIGISPKRDGLCGAQRASVMCVRSAGNITSSYKIWMDFLEGAFSYAVDELKRIAKYNLPGYIHEKSMIDYYDRAGVELSKKTRLKLDKFSKLKGYVTTHNSGYTECQEFYGALSCDFDSCLANQMVLMIDTGLKGYGDNWKDVIIPDLDYIVIEKTVGKFGKEIRVLNDLPLNLQYLVGEGF